MNIDSFDSGLGVEDIIREELQRLLPNRYSVKAGVVSDQKGHTGGDFDAVIFNDLWFPTTKAGATTESRRVHMPIDGAYAICEIKQTLDYASLDAAMEKLVVAHRLYRPKTKAHRLVENRESDSCPHGFKNPLYSILFATDLRQDIELEMLINRFFDINKSLKRLEVVRALCVLGHGTVTWGYTDSGGERRPTRFMEEDLYYPIYPVYSKVEEAKSDSALYPLMTDLLTHLYHSVLAPEDVAVGYGPSIITPKFPDSADINLPPDPEWLDLLDHPCTRDSPPFYDHVFDLGF